ncbi:MAG: hypothetical protein QGG53_11650, partial [Planctomycetota bacterium]|nr:hypothetical protein [Planctomycetota bacterium]
CCTDDKKGRKALTMNAVFREHVRERRGYCCRKGKGDSGHEGFSCKIFLIDLPVLILYSES